MQGSLLSKERTIGLERRALREACGSWSIDGAPFGGRAVGLERRALWEACGCRSADGAPFGRRAVGAILIARS